MDRLLNLTIKQFGKVDCAANSAGYDFKLSRAHELQSQSVSEQLAIDFIGVLSCMRTEVTAMLPRGGGIIANVASTTGLTGTPMAALYGAAKHAVIGLTRSTSREYIADGILINAVCPGITDTSRRERRMAHLEESDVFKLKVKVAREMPIGRVASADEISQAILWLSSPASSYVVGHSLVIDGGLLRNASSSYQTSQAAFHEDVGHRFGLGVGRPFLADCGSSGSGTSDRLITN